MCVMNTDLSLRDMTAVHFIHTIKLAYCFAELSFSEINSIMQIR